jgi:4-hydroxy-tetrahydrodipicolinate reductase
MIRVVVGGSTGRMGSVVCEMISSSDDLKLTGAVAAPFEKTIGSEIYPGIVVMTPDRIPELLKNADVYVDLTAPAAAAVTVPEIPKSGVAVVLGTTAVPRTALDALTKNVSKYGTSAVVTSNFAIGVNVFWAIAEQMAGVLKDYDIEVIEAHHSAKKDAPSGTADELVKRLQRATGIETVVHGRNGVTDGRGREIGVHSIRAGNVVGDHTVMFAGNMESLSLTHTAVSREVLARGCLASIRWISGKKDGKVHSMKEVLGL